MKIFRFLNRVIIHVLAVVALIYSGMLLQGVLQGLYPEKVAKYYSTET